MKALSLSLTYLTITVFFFLFPLHSPWLQYVSFIFLDSWTIFSSSSSLHIFVHACRSSYGPTMKPERTNEKNCITPSHLHSVCNVLFLCSTYLVPKKERKEKIKYSSSPVFAAERKNKNGLSLTGARAAIEGNVTTSIWAIEE